jgi:hypothetical protein
MSTGSCSFGKPFYVAVTRARQSVAFAVPDGFAAKGISLYRPDAAG